MKKILCTMLMLAALLISTTALAAYRETISEGADLGAVKRLAVALPDYYQTESVEPAFDDFIKIIFDASKSSRLYVISYDEIAANIQRDTGVDIKALDVLESRRVYDENISKYADASVRVSVANNPKKVQFFFDVQSAADGNLMYILTTQSGSIGKNSKDYLKACEEFYSRFGSAIDKSLKDAKKKK